MDINNLIDQNTERNSNTISVEEHKKKVLFHCAGREFYKIKIDCDKFNRLFNISQIRCDFALKNTTQNNIALLIELKGSDIKKAYEQLIQTKNLLFNQYNNIYCAIVYNNIPAQTDQQIYFKKAKNEGFLKVFYHKKILKLSYIKNKQIIEKIN